MARTGVTQEAVNTTADQLLHAGERPTIERVRAALGTGSPNTLIRLLDVWWADLGRRLQEQTAKLALPGAPAPVAALASALWEQALEAAQTVAAQTQTEARDQIAQDRIALEKERREFSQTAEDLTIQVTAARHAETLADTRLTDALRFVEQQTAQLNDLVLQRDAALQRIDRLEHELTELHTRLREQGTAAAAERLLQAQYVETVENRASIEIDRARQEARAARQELGIAQKGHARQLSLAHGQRDEAITALAAAQHDAASQRARADALERQQDQLAGLAATVQDAISGVRSKQPIQTEKNSRTQRKSKQSSRRKG